jgi:uncharacterized protein (TIGR00251 family)
MRKTLPGFTRRAGRGHASTVPGSPPPGSVPSCTLELKVIPHASRDEIAGWLGGALKVKLRAPALEGRANDALVEFIAGRLALPRRAVALIRGEKSRHKVVRIDGLAFAEVSARLGS